MINAPTLTRRLLLRVLVLMLAPLLAPALPFGTAVADTPRPVYFAEPGSGRKVGSYDVELPVNGQPVRQFNIPGDCAAIVPLLESRSANRASILDRRLWHKAASDCRYHAFVTRHAQPILVDHVSHYDFMNAAVGDLPIDPDCRAAGRDGTARCDPTRLDGNGMLRYFPLGETAPDDVANRQTAPCRLHDGLFRGHLWVDTNNELLCEGGRARPSLRLLTVDLADVNGDRIMDAVLRFVLLGPGVTRSLLALPLTRDAASDAFRTVQLPVRE